MQQPNASRYVTIGWPVFLVAFALCAGVLVHAKTLEDAFITFRYSEHFAKGVGFAVWNRGEDPVEGFTCLLWMVFLAAAKWLGFGVEATAKVTGLLCYAGLTGLLASIPWLARRQAVEPRWLHDAWGPSALAAILSVGSAANPWYATNGMETMPFALLGIAAFLSPYFAKRAWLPAILHALLVLMRPEGLLLALASGAFHGLLRAPRQRIGIVCLVVAMVVFAMLTIGRLVYFGYPLPNTYYAKVAGGPPGMHLRMGVAYSRSWMLAHWPWLVAIAVGNVVLWWRKRDREALWMLSSLSIGIVLYLAYVTKVGGDNRWAFPMWRHFVHIAPFIWLAIGFAICSCSTRTAVRIGVALLLAGLAVRGEMAAKQSPYKRGLSPYLAKFPVDITRASKRSSYARPRWMSGSQDVIASGLAGQLPYTWDAVHIDMLGLNDAYIAHHGKFDPAGPVDSKTDMAYVFSRRPDIIVSSLDRAGVQHHRSRQQLVRWRRSLIVSMLDNPVFQRDYCFVRNSRSGPRGRAIFMRTAYVASDARRSKLDCVPVLETSLYRKAAKPPHRRHRKRGPA